MAGILPSGQEDPYGAVAAGIGEDVLNVLPPDYDNEVSTDGRTVLYVSPAPEAESGRTPQLYARVGGGTPILVSRSDLTGQASSHGPSAVVGLSQPPTLPLPTPLLTARMSSSAVRIS